MKQGSRAARITGAILTPLGGAMLLGGAVVALSNGVCEDWTDATVSCAQSKRDPSTDVAAGIMIGVGVAALVTGIVLLATSSTTVSRHADRTLSWSEPWRFSF